MSFGLGKDVAVKAIIEKPSLKKWKGCIDFAEDIFTSVELKLSFDMEYKMANAGLPNNKIFDSTSFVRPKSNQSTAVQVMSIHRESDLVSIPESNQGPTVIDKHMNRCMARVVTANKQM